MNLLDQKIEEKLKLLEEYDRIFSNYQPKITPLELSKNNINNSKVIQIDKNKFNDKISKNNNKFDKIYSNFDSNKNENAYYFRNYEEMMNYMYSLSSKVLTNNDSKKSKSKSKSKNNLHQKNSKNDNRNNYKVQFMPKKDYVIEKLLRYGENLEKKKKRLKLENEKYFKKISIPSISDNAKNINRNPKKFVERLFYDKYTSDKKKNNKHDSYYYINKVDEKKLKETENSNFTYRPSINKKSLEIANKLEPSSKRLLRKKENKEIIDKEECEKLAIDNYKNLFNNNNFNKYENKKINFNEKNLIYKLYNKGLENLKKRELQYQENVHKKDEEYKNYSYSPNISINKENKSNKKMKNIKKQLIKKNKNNDLYSKQIEWKKKKILENSKKKLVQEDFYMKHFCTFKPKILTEKMKDNSKIIKRNLKTSNSYIEKRRKQIKQENQKLNKSSDNKKYGFALKDLFFTENNNVLYGDKVINTSCSYFPNKKKLINNYKKNNMNIVVPPFSQRIFCYYSEDDNMNNYNSIRNNNFSCIDYSRINFIDAINELHNEIDNLNI